MSLTRDERDKLNDLILQTRARTMESNEAKRKDMLANEALCRYIESLVGPSAPRETAPLSVCIRCQTYIGYSGYCARCAGNNTAVDAQTQQGGGIGGQDRSREKLRGDSGYR